MTVPRWPLYAAAALLIIPATAAATTLTSHHAAPAATTPAPRLVYICQQAPCASNQELEVFDGNRAPIFSVGEYGGAGVFGDQFSVFRPGDVYRPVVQLRDNATVLVGGEVLTPADIALVHALRAAGVTARDLAVLAAWAHAREARR